MLLHSDLRDRMAANQLVTAGWLQSGDWKTARALAKHHDVIVLDCEHGECCRQARSARLKLSLTLLLLPGEHREDVLLSC